ncbi:type II secretion system F family protein [Chelatococcus sp. SYSU_G07232]|uniref:Type II secretion system F family protein n=1 Tax=Chelatococcus albus TaxID=3047466 RepID=A0ABT7AE24_9HYPH|nr:type II secretion system F family protein [Chelatococcus sp. SYSU_G07232]MDJ1157641.1 type II secretion system F family protein [Chelatococcus sp. SYSU_G07232]
MDLSQIAVAFLATVAAGGVAYVFLYPLLSGEKKAEQRKKALTAPNTQRVLDRGAMAAASRREQVAQSLREMEAREKARHKATLETRLARAGLSWTRQRFFVVSGVIGFTTGLLLLVLSGHAVMGLGGLVIGGLGLPHWLLAYLRQRRIRKFMDEFPNAVDVIVRGIKAGLPLGDCLRIIANEAAEPVRSEFRFVVESQALGLPVSDAVARLPERVPVAEANFFSIVIAIQQKSGGNLSEALGNLSRVIRDRKKMKGKITAMSAEAKSSAMIIGALPFIVGGMVYMSSPKYVSLLWTTQVGQLSLVVAGLWMIVGMAVMKKMISFDF